MKKKRILVAMSGGVDSSLTAALLVEQGFEEVGATMKTFCYSDNSGPSKTCCGLDGITDAQNVSELLGIPHYVFDVEEEFTANVIDDFVAEYSAGRTPNPCVRCNSNTKFPDLLAKGRQMGCEAIASGHYVRITHGSEQDSTLFRGRDRKKDQSYFLWDLPKTMLPFLHFPLGNLDKHTVRQKARNLNLITANKPESQEICFVPTGDYRDLLERKLPTQHPSLQPGSIVTSKGEIVGSHEGFANYTVGQRKGLGGGRGDPFYVIEIRPSTREVVIGTEEQCFQPGVQVGNLNWLTNTPTVNSELGIQIRYRGNDVPAKVLSIGKSIVLEFEKPQRAVTPGQSAVFYSGDQVIGGGRIQSALQRKDLSARN